MRRNEENFDYILKKYEAARHKGDAIYFEAAELLDIYDYYAEEFRNDEAKEVLMRAVKLFPDDIDVIVAHAYYYRNIGDWTKAASIIKKLPAESIYSKLFYAEEALSRCDLAKTRSLIKEITRSEKDISYDTVLDIGEMYFDAGYYHLAEPWLYFCNKPDYAEFTRVAEELADCLFRRGELDEAISVMNRLLDEDPYDASAWIQLAKIQYTAGKYNEALESCDYALAADEKNPEAYSVRFDALLSLDRLDEMWEDLQDRTKLFFCSAENFLSLALKYERNEEFEKASKVYHLAARQSLDNSDVVDRIHRYLAHEAAMEERFDDAYDLIMRNANRENYVMRHISFATLYFITEHEDKAIETLNDTVTIPYIRPHEFEEIALLLFNAKCFQPARKVWNVIFANLTPDDVNANASLAFSALQLHDQHFPAFFEEALKEDLITVMSLFGDDFDFLDPESTMRQARDMAKQWKKEK